MRSYLHLTDFEAGGYIHLNDVLTGCITEFVGDEQQPDNGNAFVGGFVNNDLIFSPNTVPHLDVLTATLAQRYEDLPACLRRLLQGCYDNESVEGQ